MRNLLTLAALTLVAALAVPVAAGAAERVELSTSTTTIDAPDGAVTKTIIGGPVAGQHVRYIVLAKNRGDRPAGVYTPLTKIPTGLRYIPNSATPGAQFSTDGGATWSHMQTPMSSHRINAIRWVATAPLAPGARETFSYDAVVR
jgi:uncharacterized repeat protein (TIGR01451 family)